MARDYDFSDSLTKDRFKRELIRENLSRLELKKLTLKSIKGKQKLTDDILIDKNNIIDDLKIKDSEIDEFSQFAKALPKLTELRIESSKIKSFAGLPPYLQSVKNLNINNSNVDRFDDLVLLPSIESIKMKKVSPSFLDPENINRISDLEDIKSYEESIIANEITDKEVKTYKKMKGKPNPNNVTDDDIKEYLPEYIKNKKMALILNSFTYEPNSVKINGIKTKKFPSNITSIKKDDLTNEVINQILGNGDTYKSPNNNNEYDRNEMSDYDYRELRESLLKQINEQIKGNIEYQYDLNGFPNYTPVLKELELQYMPITSLKGLPTQTPNLQVFKLEKTSLIKNLKGMPTDLSSIETISLSELESLESFEGMPDEIDSDESVDLNISEVGAQTLKGLPKKIRNLGNFTLNTISKLSSFKNLPQIENISNSSQIDFSDLGSDVLSESNDPNEVTSDFRMRDIPFTYYQANRLKFNSVPIKSLQGMPTLLSKTKSLEIYGTKIITLQGISELPQIEMLKINGNSELIDIHGLPNQIPHLKTIHLQYNDLLESLNGFPQEIKETKNILISNNNLKSLRGFPLYDLDQLEHLDLSSNEFDHNLEPMPFKYLPRELPHLNELNISNLRLTNDQLKHLPDAPDLKIIDFRNNRGITDKGLDYIQKYKKLESINLMNTSIETLENIPYNSNIKHLYTTARLWRGIPSRLFYQTIHDNSSHIDSILYNWRTFEGNGTQSHSNEINELKRGMSKKGAELLNQCYTDFDTHVRNINDWEERRRKEPEAVELIPSCKKAFNYHNLSMDKVALALQDPYSSVENKKNALDFIKNDRMDREEQTYELILEHLATQSIPDDLKHEGETLLNDIRMNRNQIGISPKIIKEENGKKIEEEKKFQILL